MNTHPPSQGDLKVAVDYMDKHGVITQQDIRNLFPTLDEQRVAGYLATMEGVQETRAEVEVPGKHLPQKVRAFKRA